MNSMTAFSLSMWATIASASLVGVWLWYRASESVSLRALAAYCIALAFWCTGHLLAIKGASQWAIPLLLSSPLLPTAFLHFVLAFCTEFIPKLKRYQNKFWLLYVIAGIVTAGSVALTGAELKPWLTFPHFISLHSPGWINLAYTALLGVIAHLILLQALRVCPANQRRSITAMFIVGGLGFVLAISFISPSIGLNTYPYPMLALPTYSLLLVYAVVRYQLVEVNRLVNRAVVWLALLVITMLVMSVFLAISTRWGLTELSEIPLWQLLIYSSALLLIAGLLYGPAQQFANRLVYPEIRFDQLKLDQWGYKLDQAKDWLELSDTIKQLWSRNSPTLIDVAINQPLLTTEHPAFIINQVNTNDNEHWQCKLVGWRNATPSEQHLAEIVTSLLPTTCAALDRGMKLAAAERQKLAQEHLVELGGLTATIAHELRNPLNIINMAAVQTDPSIQTHISNQVQRAEQLIQDVLSYAGQIQLRSENIQITSLIENVARQTQQLFNVKIHVNITNELNTYADPQKLHQVLTNLLENAAAFVNQTPEGLIEVDAHTNQQQIQINIHNNGPSIPQNIQGQLFSPFVSNRSGGSGLGLAIVRRIIDAHHGRVWHHTDAGWPVTFSIEIPRSIDRPNAIIIHPSTHRAS
ncbi:ATP-binding protein [Alkalimarinus alittae]|uniref:histidine kinase n=2 Tax=Alkalimarinus alittae TaxID=2961619 RepID=A0ABY6N6Q0_9ALTE|nr:sensor histidine kinase [Alkalimarinus alittae]UZE97788.1 ATP-binding protein [Alkalimarinus alittae]